MTKFEKAYKYKFVPLIITGTALLIVLALKYVMQAEVGNFFNCSILLTVVAFFYYRAIDGFKKDAEKEAAKNAPPPSKEEIQKIHETEMQANIEQQKTNIIFRSFYLFLGVLLLLLSISLLIFNKEYLWGGILATFSILFIIHSVFLLRKWIVYMKFFKQEKNKNVFDDKNDNRLKS